MSLSQPGIFAPVPSFSRYLEFGAVRDMDPIIGLGPGLVQGFTR